MSLTWVGGLVTAAAGLVVLEFVTGWIRAGVRRLTSAIRSNPFARGADDHLTIHSGWIRVDSGGWPRIHVHVRCAPSRQWKDRHRMRLDGMYRFVHRVRAGQFPHDAHYSVPDELIRFMTSDAAISPSDPGVACCAPNGVIELAIPLPCRTTADGLVLAASAVAELIAAFHAEIASGAYDRIYGVTPRRLDWMLNISPSITAGDFTSQPWTEIDFPGRRPTSRAQGMRPPADPRGYGRDATQSLAIHVDPAVLLRWLFTDLLERNGYHDITGAVTDTVEAAARHRRRALTTK